MKSVTREAAEATWSELSLQILFRLLNGEGARAGIDGERLVAQTGVTGASMTTHEQRAGLARLMLRWPEVRATLRERSASDEILLGLCESYDLACNAAVHWSTSDSPGAAAIADEYRGLVTELEFEARQRASAASR